LETESAVVVCFLECGALGAGVVHEVVEIAVVPFAPAGRVLLTGATGVVGTAVRRALRGHDVVALVRGRRPAGDVAAVRGDVCRPRLGLDPAAHEDLRRTVSVVVHCAAMTHLGRGGDHAAVNVGGTEEVLRFAAAAGCALIHMSTAFVQERLSDVEAPSGYEASKRAAEASVRASGVRAVVLRPSLVVGDSRTGEIAADQALHTVLGGLVIGRIPVLPGEPDAVVDFVPQDHLAAVVRALVETAPDRWPAALWVTQGRAAMRIGEILETANVFARSKGLTHEPARCVSYDTVQRLFMPVFLPELPPPLQKEFRSLFRLIRYLNIVRCFPEMPGAVAEGLGIGAPPAPRPTLERNIAAWWERIGRAVVEAPA
jgi:nucleoside-diphosphate-sugar epimerase